MTIYHPRINTWICYAYIRVVCWTVGLFKELDSEIKIKTFRIKRSPQNGTMRIIYLYFTWVTFKKVKKIYV